MTPRIMIPELRRTLLVPLLLGFLLAASSLARDSMNDPWPGLVMPVLTTHQANLTLLWPLALVLGGLVGGRDRAAGVSELLATTPRRWARAGARAVLLTIGLAVAYLVAPIDQIFLATRAGAYWPSGWVWPLLVGALGVGAAALLGLALGHRLPSRWLLLPVLAGGLLVTGAVFWLIDRSGSGSLSRTLLLFPSYSGADAGEFAAIAGRTSAGQAVWFAALAGTGFVLYSGSRWDRRRTLPAVAFILIAGLALALPVLPSKAQAQTQDAGAVELVCAAGRPRVCVARPYAKVLPELVGPARAALQALAQLPNAPTAVLQDTRDPRSSVRQPADTVLIQLSLDHDGHLVTGGDSVEANILAGAGALWCGRRTDNATQNSEFADRTVAAAWLLGRTQPPVSGIDDPDQLVARAWKALHEMPLDEQRTRIAALRQARLQCRDNEYQILTGGAVS